MRNPVRENEYVQTEADRYTQQWPGPDGVTNEELERRQSGNLPAQPAGLPSIPAPGNSTPWKNLTSGG